MNLLLQIRAPALPAHEPVQSQAPTVVVLAQPSWTTGVQARASLDATKGIALCVGLLGRRPAARSRRVSAGVHAAPRPAAGRCPAPRAREARERISCSCARPSGPGRGA